MSRACGGGTTFVGPNTASDGTITLDNNIRITATTANVGFSSLEARAEQAGT